MNKPVRKKYIAILFLLYITLSISIIQARTSPFQNKHVLVICIDGLRSDACKAAHTPNIKSLAESGTVSWDAYSGGILDTPAQQATVSGPSWASIFTGVWTDKHGIIDNTFNGYNSTGYPHFFKRIREKNKSAFLSSLIDWESGDRIFIEPIASLINHRYVPVECVTSDLHENAVAHLSSASPDAVFVFFGEPDCSGHAYGYSPDSPEYLKAIEKIDQAVGDILNAVKNRPDYKNENWLIIITCDHGGVESSHGWQSSEERSVPFIVNGRDIPVKTISPGPGITAVAPTVLAFLGIDIDPEWGWADPPFGIEAKKPVIISSPLNQAVEEEDTAFFSAAVWGTKLSFQWMYNDKSIPGAVLPYLVLKDVSAKHAGNYKLKASDGTHTVTTTAAKLTIKPLPPLTIGGQWDFIQGNLMATKGEPLAPGNDSVEKDLVFGTTESFGIPGIQEENVHIMHFIPSSPGWPGLIFATGLKPNGGGIYINKYTVIYDIFYPERSDKKWRALLQTNERNCNDAEFYIGLENGLGINGTYHGIIRSNKWHRIIISVDCTVPVAVKYIDGKKAGIQTLPSGTDGRWSLDSKANFFADDESDNSEGYVSSIQIRRGLITDEDAKKLGGASAGKIPLEK